MSATKQVEPEGSVGDENTALLSEEVSLDPQLELKVSNQARDKLYLRLLLVVFIDSLGPLILTTAEASLVGGQDAFPDQAFTSLPAGFSMSKALLGAATQVGAFMSMAFIVPQSDKVGRRPMLSLFLFGGALVFLVAVFLGDIKYTGDMAYYLYLLCKFLMGLLGGSRGTATLMVTDIFTTPEEKVAKSNALMPLMLIAMSIGGLAGGISIGSTGTLLMGAWVSMAISFVGGLVVVFGITEPAREKKQDHKKDDDAALPADGDVEMPSVSVADEPIPPLFKSIMLAHLFDSIGTNGLTCALTLIIFERFEIFKEDPSLVGTTATLLVVFIVLGMVFSIPSLKTRGAGFNAVFGNATTCIAQIILIFINNWILFLAVLYIGYSCSFFSTVSYMPMIIHIAPESKKAKMQGSYGAITALTAAVMPILIAVIVDSIGGVVALALCAAFSLAGTVASIPLTKHFPRPIPNAPLTDEEKAILKTDENYYEAEELIRINQERRAKGEGYLNLKYGSYQKDKDSGRLAVFRKVAKSDLLKSKASLASRIDVLAKGGVEAESLEEGVRKQFQLYQQDFEAGMCDEDAKEMGLWMANYFYDAGQGWRVSPTLFKIVIMSAFPRLPRMGDEGVSLLESLPAYISWVDKAVELESHNPDNELLTMAKHWHLRL